MPILALIAISGWLVNGHNGGQAPASATRQAPAQQAMAPTGAVSGQRGSKDGSSPHQYPNGVISGESYKNDVSPALRDIPPAPLVKGNPRIENENPSLMPHNHLDQLDTVVQKFIAPLVMPTPILNFDGIPFPGVVCNCAPPDTNGEVGATQYVQIVNEGYQVFRKSDGVSLLGPVAITNIWSGFGGVCQTAGDGDPVVLYDQLANRWLISQFAGSGVPTDECIAVSTSNDATGTYNRYGFHLGTNFFDYPHLAVWPDAYYMADNVFNSAGTLRLGPQPFAFNRAAMLAGTAATFVSTGITGGNNESYYLPADLDGSILPPVSAPNSFVEWPGSGAYKVFHFHADFVTPANSTFTLFSSPAAAGFTALCPATRNCVPELGGEGLDGIGDRLMFRAADRFFPDGHESLVGNYSVSSGGVAGVRWFELRNVTSGPVTKFQESTYQPDTTWRWMGSTAMDTQGNMALGFSASSASIFPQIRYAGRLVGDPVNTLAQGEATLFSGTGSQTATGDRWGDYSDMTVDPVDDCTFWYTQEYYATTGSFNWRTRIGNFKFPNCTNVAATPTRTVTGTPPTVTRTPTLTFTPSLTPTPCGGGNYSAVAGAATIVPGATDIGNHCDDCQTTVSLPFPFQLYDQTFTTVDVESNGKAHFVTGIASFTNACLPASGYTFSIFPYWDDLRTDVGTGSGIFTSVSGSSPNQIFNIEWRATYFTGGTTANFELRLYQGQNRFDIVYSTLTLGNTSATSGVQKDATFFTQYFCNAAGGAATGSVAYTLPTCATPRSLVGHVSWQGRTVGSAAYQAPISLTLKSGATEVNYPVQNTDTSGFFTVSLGTLSNGAYQFRAKGPNGGPPSHPSNVNDPPGFLAVTGTATLSSAPTIQVEMGLMKAGDANNDNIITVSDFNILRITSGRGSGDPGYDGRADFDGNALVNIQDFNLLRGNYGVQGGGPISPVDKEHNWG